MPLTTTASSTLSTVAVPSATVDDIIKTTSANITPLPITTTHTSSSTTTTTITTRTTLETTVTSSNTTSETTKDRITNIVETNVTVSNENTTLAMNQNNSLKGKKSALNLFDSPHIISEHIKYMTKH